MSVEKHIKQIIPANIKLYRNDHKEEFSELIVGYALIEVDERDAYKNLHEHTEQILPFTNTSILTDGDYYDADMIENTDLDRISITEKPLFDVMRVLSNNKYFYKNESEEK